MSANLTIKVEDFRAIKKASIDIEGITLVAGENGCGKSTLSKLLYYLFQTVENYENLVKQEFYTKLNRIIKFLDTVQEAFQESFQDPFSISTESFEIEKFSFQREIKIIKGLSLSEDSEGIFVLLNKLIDSIENLYINNCEKSQENKNSIKHIFFNHTSNRLSHIYKDLFGKGGVNFEDIGEVRSVFLQIKADVNRYLQEAIADLQNKPARLFFKEIEKIFSSFSSNGFEILEYDSVLVSSKKTELIMPYSIAKSVYIDTPMSTSVETEKNPHWQDLNELLYNQNDTDNSHTEIVSHINTEVIDGNASVEEKIIYKELKFNRNDGSIFDLTEVATGIKSFSIIQLLLKNGHLNKDTLLIIDEPESNLHPQWIVEYARLIVLLHKEIGVKFFLASHNPDMVSAIRYIAEKEEVLDKTNFYLAEKDNDYQYEYKPLGNEIAPIFESFNIALDRINEYGI